MRLSPCPCATLQPDLTAYPKVAQIVPSTYNGHVIMYTKTNIMSIKERNNIPSTALPAFDLQPGEPSDLCVSIKLPRTYLEQ